MRSVCILLYGLCDVSGYAFFDAKVEIGVGILIIFNAVPPLILLMVAIMDRIRFKMVLIRSLHDWRYLLGRVLIH